MTLVTQSMDVKPMIYSACYREPLPTLVLATADVFSARWESVTVGIAILSTAFVPEKHEIYITSPETPRPPARQHTPHTDRPPHNHCL